jgi:hypothetical protein
MFLVGIDRARDAIARCAVDRFVAQVRGGDDVFGRRFGRRQAAADQQRRRVADGVVRKTPRTQL